MRTDHQIYWPKISIITPSFNQGQYIAETIESVLNQEYPNVEHIIIDGASSDDTVKVVSSYLPNIDLFISEPDSGQSEAINKGMKLATGEILTWLNSDDCLAPGALHAIALAFKTSDADLVAGVCELHKDGQYIESHLTSCSNGQLPLEDLLDLEGCWFTGKFFYQPEVFFSRAIWEMAGSHVSEEYYYSMDYELWLRFAKCRAYLHVIGQPVAEFRIHQQQKTHSGDFLAELPKVRDAFATTHSSSLRGSQTRVARGIRMLFLNDLGSIGGASIAHQRLVQATTAAGHDILNFAVSDFVDPSSPAMGNDAIVDAIEQLSIELVVLGNLHGAGLPATLVDAISQKWPTVCVLHDLWMITGRCPYPRECELYLTGCNSSCPTAHEYPPLAPHLVGPAWESRMNMFANRRRPYLLANSTWTHGEVARTAMVPTDSLGRVRLSVPTHIFKPQSRSMCRLRFNLPQHAFVLLFSSSSIHDPRKGYKFLRDAIDQLNLPGLVLACIGRLHDTRPDNDVVYLGHLDDPAELAAAYAAADIFVGPSLDETFGQVFIEAAACGTPSVGFPAGGVKEAIYHGVSGLLATEFTADALATAISRLYAEPHLRSEMAMLGPIWVANEWSQIRSYQSLIAALDEAGVLKQLGVAAKTKFSATSPPPRPELLNGHMTPRSARLLRLTSWAGKNFWWYGRRVYQHRRILSIRTLIHKALSRVR